jgi:hypothetical protein
MSLLEIEVTYRKKDENSKNVFIDRRKLKAQQTPREKLIKSISESLEKLGIMNGENLAKDLSKIKDVEKLNKDLLCLVYQYYASKNFSIENVLINFDEDFEEQLDIISKLNIFNKLSNPSYLYSFRQDFCCYLFLIYDFENKGSTEDYSSYESYDSNSN